MGEKRVVLFAGTTEGRLLAGYVAQMGCKAVVCVATEYGQELLERGAWGGMAGTGRGGLGSGMAGTCGGGLGSGVAGTCGGGLGGGVAGTVGDEAGMADAASLDIRQGRLDQEGMERLFDEVRPGMVIDATHPYAEEVTKTIQRACEARPRLRLLRCLRDSSEGIGEVVRVPDIGAAAAWLGGRPGNILVTTGTKELQAFCEIQDYRQRVYARVLPFAESVEICRKLGYEGRHIIAMQGPFSLNMNVSTLKEFDCRYLVTKDGGRAGGVNEKLEAARQTGAVTVLVNRPDGDRGISLDEIKMQIKEWISHEG